MSERSYMKSTPLHHVEAEPHTENECSQTKQVVAMLLCLLMGGGYPI